MLAAMYSRNLRKPSPTKNVFKFSSFKNNRTIMCESSLEFDACFHFEYDRDVVSFESQPLGIEFTANDRIRRYTPDFRVRYGDGSERLVEVKPQSKTLSADFLYDFGLKRQAYADLGYQLLLVTDQQIRAMPFLDNLKLLNKYASFQPDSELQQSVLNYIRSVPGSTLGQISEELNISFSILMPSCAAMICKGFLDANLSEVDLSGQSILKEVIPDVY